MKNWVYILKLNAAALLMISALTSCEDVVDLDTQAGPPQLVVDGWINNLPGKQTIRLTWSAAYFDNSAPKPVLGASVIVTDNLGKQFVFTDSAGTGSYTWGKTSLDTLGKVGRTYNLEVKNGENVFTATSELKRVPTIDSLTYRKEKLPFKPDDGPQEGFVAQFYARDFTGIGDTYWIKPVLNGKTTVNKAANISIAYDAAFNAGAPSDGLIFILPLRESITVDSLFSAGQSFGVEIHSITGEAFEFLKVVREQASNGGLFATPIVNAPSNIVNQNPSGEQALGFFCISAVVRKESVIDPEKARPDDE